MYRENRVENKCRQETTLRHERFTLREFQSRNFSNLA